MAVVYKQKIFVEKAELEAVEKVLNIREGYAKGYGSGELIASYSTVFHTPYANFGVDLNVYNADSPYVDPVLFEIVPFGQGGVGWFEIHPLDVSDTLLQPFTFTLDKENWGEDIELHVDVVAKPATE